MKDNVGQTAFGIAERLLDQSGKCLISGDFVTFRTLFHVPHEISVPHADCTIKNETELKIVFFEMVEKLKRFGVTDLIRFVEAAAFRTPDEIASTHVTHLMAGTQRLQEPYPVFSVIRKIDGSWRCASSDYAIDPKSPMASTLLRPGRAR